MIDDLIVSIEEPKRYIAFVIDLGRRTSPTSLSPQRPASVAESEKAFLTMCDFAFQRDTKLFLAKVGDTPAGFFLFIDFLPDDVTTRPQGFIAYMAVEEPLRSRGIGRALLDAAEAYAREKGLPAIALMVTEANQGAASLYRKAGYQVERMLLCKPLQVPEA
jgi:ribosomal protein S18 acetylase RimI-like enzyme